MGNTNSAFKVINEARYEITVEVFSPKDVGEEFVKQKVILPPGQQTLVRITKRGARLRVSGNGRTQDTIFVQPGEVVPVRKVLRGTASTHATKANSDEVVPVVEELVDKPGKQDEEPSDRNPAPENPHCWLDEKSRYTKDELEQLTVKLRKETVKTERARILKEIQEKGYSSSRGPDDDLTRLTDSTAEGNDSQFSSEDDLVQREAADKDSAFINTDPESDDLVAAINKFTSAQRHTQKPNWDISPHIFAHA